MKFKLGSIMLFSLSAFSVQAMEQRPELFECNTNSKDCSWVIIKSKVLVKQEKDAQLYNVEVRWGSSSHKNGRYPKAFSRKLAISWVPSTDKFSLFCYNKLPVHIGGEYNILNFNDGGWAVRTPIKEYVRICYGSPWDMPISSAFINEHGLSKPITEELTGINAPEDLFKYVK